MAIALDVTEHVAKNITARDGMRWRSILVCIIAADMLTTQSTELKSSRVFAMPGGRKTVYRNLLAPPLSCANVADARLEKRR